MRPEAYFINVARGPIVDEQALIDCLKGRRIAGAALDVFEREPVDPSNPLLAMDNVIVTAHSLLLDRRMLSQHGLDRLRGIVDALGGRVPKFVVDRDVLKHPRVQAWLRA